MVRFFVISIIFLVGSGCATLPRDPVPSDRVFDAEIPGIPGVRAWGGILSEDFQTDLIESRQQEAPDQFPRDKYGNPVYDALALSGGGATGAYGAGFLNGWTKAGDRPDFKMVSGISTGALTAPIAFLGSKYDDLLREFFTTVETDSILQRLSLVTILFQSESFASTAPLKKLLDRHFDLAFLRKIADRHNQGYRLYIGTHHMDAQRLVVWNMGLIANSNHPDAAELFRNVILASASIPIAFPPVLIKSEVDGVIYDEMHVDGGVSVQVFFYAGTVNARAALAAAAEETNLEDLPENPGDLYIIRNGQLSSHVQQIPRELSKITSRTVDSMIKISAVGDLYRIYSFAQRDGINFFYTAVPADYAPKSTEAFDKADMNRLFNIGLERGASGEAWKTKQPGLESENQE